MVRHSSALARHPGCLCINDCAALITGTTDSSTPGSSASHCRCLKRGMCAELVPQLLGREPERLLFVRVRFDSIGKEPPKPQLEGSVPAMHCTDVGTGRCACAQHRSSTAFFRSFRPLLAEGIPTVCMPHYTSALHAKPRYQICCPSDQELVKSISTRRPLSISSLTAPSAEGTAYLHTHHLQGCQY